MAGKHIKFDWAIKRLLRNKANFEILEGFLSELLMFDVSIQEILEGEGNQTDATDKYNRVDILVKDKDDNFMLIEVQNERQDDYYHRMLYGQAKLITERLNIGDEYGKLTKVYSINIVYFPLGVGKDYVYISDGSFKGLYFNDELQLSDKQKKLYNAEKVEDLFTQYYIIKLNTFDKEAENSLEEWIYFLKNNEIKDSFKAKGIEKANEILRIDNLSVEDKRAYETFIKNQRIHQSELATAYTDGELKSKKALEESEQKRQEAEQRAEFEKLRAEEEKQRADKEHKNLIETAKLLLSMQVEIDIIAEKTGLSKSEIEQLNT